MEFLNFKKYYDEYLNCANNPYYFLENYYKPSNEVIKLYPHQKGMIWNFQQNKATIVKSCRQSGKSSISLGYGFWAALFHNKAVMIVSMTRMMCDNLAKIIQNQIKEGNISCKINNRSHIEFEGGGRISFMTPSSTSICGRTYDLLIIDEMAYMDHKNINAFFLSAFPIISSTKGSKVIVVSSLNRPDDLFYKLYLAALDPSTNSYFKAMEINWWDLPHFQDISRVEAVRKTIGDKIWKLEYENRF